MGFSVYTSIGANGPSFSISKRTTIDFNQHKDKVKNGFDLVDMYSAKLETITNFLGYYPCVSSIAAPFRLIFGLIQTVASFAASVFYLIRDSVSTSEEGFGKKSLQCLTYSLHGFANIFRAFVESIPVYGNISVLIYDFVLEQRVKYSLESRIEESEEAVKEAAKKAAKEAAKEAVKEVATNASVSSGPLETGIVTP